MLDVKFLDQAARNFKKLIKKAPNIAAMIESRILALRENPEPPSSISLEGYIPFRRIRVEKYRVIYKHDGKTLYIIIIGKRDKVYKRLPKVKGR